MRAPHQIDEGNVSQRLDQMNRADSTQTPLHHLAHIRIRMHRINNLHILASRQPDQRLADALEPLAETLPPVRRNQHQFFPRIQRRQPPRPQPPRGQRIARFEDRVDSRIPRDENPPRVHAFAP